VKPRWITSTERLVVVAVSRLVGLSSFLRTGDKFIEAPQKGILGIIILCVALVLSLCIGSSPRIKSNGLVTAQSGIKSVNASSLDVMPNVKCLPFEFGNPHIGLIEDETVRGLPPNAITENANKTPESGSSKSGLPPDGKVIADKPSDNSPKGGPQNYLDWSYEHFLLSAIVSFMVGFFARKFLPNRREPSPASDGSKQRK